MEHRMELRPAGPLPATGLPPQAPGRVGEPAAVLTAGGPSVHGKTKGPGEAREPLKLAARVPFWVLPRWSPSERSAVWSGAVAEQDRQDRTGDDGSWGFRHKWGGPPGPRPRDNVNVRNDNKCN